MKSGDLRCVILLDFNKKLFLHLYRLFPLCAYDSRSEVRFSLPGVTFLFAAQIFSCASFLVGFLSPPIRSCFPVSFLCCLRGSLFPLCLCCHRSLVLQLVIRFPRRAFFRFPLLRGLFLSLPDLVPAAGHRFP
jgi:hypothetical protein